ncbi:hypothetical protein PTW35_20390 (plasmid) [Photobacterium sp. DA100]|uniref:hypothetical protein n=1 Tax=Photobacterium sp. DA100 TaxID=3027472 RepID=UPI0024791304|nr:hypothetical protein [Photobacterium sp. DA100]WEM45441.1 hypothetical protein PTW35_20390 [Photobacterium sp. DA100]
MKKTIISLSIIALLAGCGGGGSSTPDNKKPVPKVDFPLKGATFDAAKLNSTTLSIKEYNSSFMEDDALVEANYEKSTYQMIEDSDIAVYDILNKLANEEGIDSFYSVNTTEYQDAELTQPTDQDSSFAGKLANKHFITYIDKDASKDQQLWALPDFVANGDFALSQLGKYQATFVSELSGLSTEDIHYLLEDNGVEETHDDITRCDEITVTRTFDFSRASTEVITVNSKKIEAMKFYIRDEIAGQCYGETDRDLISLMALRNNDPVGLEVWVNPALGIVKGIEKNDSKKKAYLVELIDFSMNQ